jgi:hypothetical protein
VASKNRSKNQTRKGSGAKSGSRAGPAGRVTRPDRAQPEPAPESEALPDLDVRAVDRLVVRADKAIPKGRVCSAFSGTTGLSPNAVTVVGALPAVVVVAASVGTHQPVLLLVAAGVMVATILFLMKFVNSTRVVAELPANLVVLMPRRGELEVRHRVAKHLVVEPYRDRRWLKVNVAGERLWVAKRAYGAVVERLAEADTGTDVESDD